MSSEVDGSPWEAILEPVFCDGKVYWPDVSSNKRPQMTDKVHAREHGKVLVDRTRRCRIPRLTDAQMYKDSKYMIQADFSMGSQVLESSL